MHISIVVALKNRSGHAFGSSSMVIDQSPHVHIMTLNDKIDRRPNQQSTKTKRYDANIKVGQNKVSRKANSFIYFFNKTNSFIFNVMTSSIFINTCYLSC